MSKPLKMRQDSLVYVKGSISVDHDLTGFPVYVAMPQAYKPPALSDFQPATVTDVTADDGIWTVAFRILIGPGGSITKGAGLYDWTVKLTDSPEVPVMKGGQIQITVT